MRELKDFGDILNRIGPRGKYQKIFLYGVMTPIAIVGPVMNLIPIFLFQVTDHWCKLPNSEGLAPDELEYLKNVSLPGEIGSDGLPRYSQCQIYDGQGNKIDCPNGWDFDRRDLSQTFASEFDWVCSRSHYSTVLLTLIEAGGGVGTILFGCLSDRIGRRPVFFISLSLYLTLRLFTCFTFVASHFVLLAILIFVGSMGRSTMHLMPLMILSEMCDDGLRGFTISFLFGAYIVGAASTPYIAYFSGHWFTMVLVSTLPCYGIFLSGFFMPESPRWLTSVGRAKEAASAVRKVAAVNGTLDKLAGIDLEETLGQIHKSQIGGQNTDKPNFRQLLGKSLLARRMILLMICWSANDLVFDVITLNTPNMSGDQFLTFFLLTVIEFPSCLVGGFLVSRIGRRATATSFELLTTIACLLCAGFLTSPSLKTVVVICTFIAKFSVNLTCMMNDIQACEILPTPLRGTGTSMTITVANIVSIFGPFIVLTGSYTAFMPYLIMGVILAGATVAASFLPETIHQDLPETVEAANEFAKDAPFWKFLPPKKPERTQDSRLSSISSLRPRRKSLTVQLIQ